MDSQIENVSELTTRQKYLKSEAYKKSHALSKLKYYHSHPEYREKTMKRVYERRKCEKEFKTEFKRLSAIAC